MGVILLLFAIAVGIFFHKSVPEDTQIDTQAGRTEQQEVLTQDTEAAGNGQNADSGQESDAVEESASGENNLGGSDSESDGNKDNGVDAESDRNGNNGSAQSSSVQTASAAGGPLQVIGTQLCDLDGNPVQLRGISTHGIAWYPQYINDELFAQLHEEWNVNVIRLAMYTAESGGYCSDGNQEQLKSLLADGVKYATENDMYVIIDWHILSDGNPNTYKSQSKLFFEEISKAYASYDNVIYEICNEPNGGTSWSQVKSYAEEIIPVIRANDADAVIIVGTPNWSQYVNEAAADPIRGYNNIMYSLHFYADTHQDSLRNTMTQAIEAGLPIFVTEYGICDAGGSGAINTVQADKWVSTMNAYGVSYVAWNLSNKSETSAILKSSCSKNSHLTQEDLSDSGKWLYRMLTGGAGAMAPNSAAGNAAESTDTGNTATENAGSGNAGTQNTNTGNNRGNEAAEEHILGNADVAIQASVVNSWESGGQYFYQYSLTLTNISDSAGTGWSIGLGFNEAVTLSGSWNGNFTADGMTLHIDSMDYNGTLSAGGTTGDIGFIVSGTSELCIQ